MLVASESFSRSVLQPNSGQELGGGRERLTGKSEDFFEYQRMFLVLKSSDGGENKIHGFVTFVLKFEEKLHK